MPRPAPAGAERWHADGLNASSEGPVLAAGAALLCEPVVDRVVRPPATGRVLRRRSGDPMKGRAASGTPRTSGPVRWCTRPGVDPDPEECTAGVHPTTIRATLTSPVEW